jgi:hypothetical protein
MDTTWYACLPAAFCGRRPAGRRRWHSNSMGQDGAFGTPSCGRFTRSRPLCVRRNVASTIANGRREVCPSRRVRSVRPHSPPFFHLHRGGGLLASHPAGVAHGAGRFLAYNHAPYINSVCCTLAGRGEIAGGPWPGQVCGVCRRPAEISGAALYNCVSISFLCIHNDKEWCVGHVAASICTPHGHGGVPTLRPPVAGFSSGGRNFFC